MVQTTNNSSIFNIVVAGGNYCVKSPWISVTGSHKTTLKHMVFKAEQQLCAP